MLDGRDHVWRVGREATGIIFPLPSHTCRCYCGRSGCEVGHVLLWLRIRHAFDRAHLLRVHVLLLHGGKEHAVWRAWDVTVAVFRAEVSLDSNGCSQCVRLEPVGTILPQPLKSPREELRRRKHGRVGGHHGRVGGHHGVHWHARGNVAKIWRGKRECLRLRMRYW